MEKRPTITQRAPSIGQEFNVRLAWFSRDTDVEPKLSLALAGSYRVNLLRLAIGVALAGVSVASAVASARSDKKQKR